MKKNINPLMRPAFCRVLLIMAAFCVAARSTPQPPAGRLQPRPRLAFTHYPKMQIGFSTQNFQKAEPVNVSNLTSYIEYATREGYSFIELRDNMATLSGDECRVLAAVAKRNKIAVIYEIQKNPLDPAFGEVFKKALDNTLLLPGPGILRALVSQSEFDADSTKKGWTKEELIRVGRLLDRSAAMAKARHIRFIVENLNEPFFGDPPAYYGLADLFAITTGTGLQFDIGNAFRNSSRAPADPGRVARWLSIAGHRWVTSHLKTLQGGSSQPFLTENPLPVEKVVELMGRQNVLYATIELLPVADRQQCYDNHAKSIQFLKEKGILQTPAFAMKVNPPDKRCFELRIYSCYPGRREALIQRFRDHTIRVFDKHKMESIGYWLPSDSAQNTLYYILAYPSRQARDSAWNAFHADPEWVEIVRQSEASGKIVEKVTSVFMNAAEMSPAIGASHAAVNRSFELRTYYCPPGKLPDLLARFRDHTIRIFHQHGMESIGYWTTMESDGSQPRLVYMLAHPTEEDAQKAWTAFRNDPVWIKAKADSEKDGSIVDKTASVFLTPLPFSKIR